jgi:hypothetical protein
MIDYLKTQLPRMSSEQIGLVNRVAALPEKSEPLPVERDRLSTLYIWLHMKPGSVRRRKFTAYLK